jgi:hypothetical protein
LTTTDSETAEGPKRGRGRRTKEEEARDYFAELGLDSSVFDALKDRGEIEIPDDAAMLEEFKKALYVQMSTGQLKSTALVQGLKAIALIAATARPSEDTGPERGIDEILADAGLPLERRREIGVQELERLHSRAAALETIVKNIKEATNV